MITSYTLLSMKKFAKLFAYSLSIFCALLGTSCNGQLETNRMLNDLDITRDSITEPEKLDFDNLFYPKAKTFTTSGFEILEKTFEFAEPSLLSLYGIEAEQEKCLFCSEPKDPALLWSWDNKPQSRCCPYCLFGPEKAFTINNEGEEYMVGNREISSIDEKQKRTKLDLTPKSKLGYVFHATSDLLEKMCKLRRRPFQSRTPQNMHLAESIERCLPLELLPYYLHTLAYAATLHAENKKEDLRNAVESFLNASPMTLDKEPILLATCVDFWVSICANQSLPGAKWKPEKLIDLSNRIACFLAQITTRQKPLTIRDLRMLTESAIQYLKFEYLDGLSLDRLSLAERIKKLDLGESPRSQYLIESKKAIFDSWYDRKEGKLTREGLEFSSSLAEYGMDMLKRFYELKDNAACSSCGHTVPEELIFISKPEIEKKEILLSSCPSCLYGPDKLFKNQKIDFCTGEGTIFKIDLEKEIVEQGEKEKFCITKEFPLATSSGSNLCRIVGDSIELFTKLCEMPRNAKENLNLEKLNPAELIEQSLTEEKLRMVLFTMTHKTALYERNKISEEERTTLNPNGNIPFEVFPIAVSLSLGIESALQATLHQVNHSPQLQKLFHIHKVSMIPLEASKFLASLALKRGGWTLEKELEKTWLYAENIVRGCCFSLNGLNMNEHIELVPIKTYQEEEKAREEKLEKYFKGEVTEENPSKKNFFNLSSFFTRK